MSAQIVNQPGRDIHGIPFLPLDFSLQRDQLSDEVKARLEAIEAGEPYQGQSSETDQELLSYISYSSASAFLKAKTIMEPVDIDFGDVSRVKEL